MTDDPRARLKHEIGLRSFSDRFLDAEEEREVIQIASRIGIKETATPIAEICRELGAIREGDLRSSIREKLDRDFSLSKMDESNFQRFVAAMPEAIVLGERDLQRIVVAVIDESGRPKIKRGWFSNWYASLKKSLGMP